VGTISNYHLALVPQRENGVKHPDCLELARRFFFAIDANKTGYCEPVPASLRPTRWPHFMGKTPSFESECVLGQLYTRIKQEAKTLSNVHFTGGEEDNVFFDLDILRKGEDMHSFKQEALKDFEKYKDESMAWFRQNKQFQADPEHYRKLKGDFSRGLRRKLQHTFFHFVKDLLPANTSTPLFLTLSLSSFSSPVSTPSHQATPWNSRDARRRPYRS
jgi:hypothetical protein